MIPLVGLILLVELVWVGKDWEKGGSISEDWKIWWVVGNHGYGPVWKMMDDEWKRLVWT